MSVNVYDVSYEMEKAIRQSNEYNQLKKLYDQVNADESANQMFQHFRDLQLQLQQKQMMGQEITQEEVEQAQKTVALVQQHPTISKLMEAEQRMSMLIAELNRIIMKPLEELYGPMQL
ncbi:YlbF family regulator [Peribacillus tepidiphilus]|uniref:YlbF family regulator n=1 Tax=Peribacillus tepidiphilus TaxID=2652445 RepID=UPI0012919C65|nr:YlbF family regulator [Peribacillus tepidiphilus]